MRVAIDARRLQDRPLTGAGRWLANLVPLLAAQIDLVLLTDARRPPPPGFAAQVPLAVPSAVPEVVWLQWSAARWLAGQRAVFHGTFNAVPFVCSRPSVVTLFDLSFEHHPEDFSEAKRRVFCLQARWAARHAAVVVTVSDHARRSIIETYGVDPDRIVVAPPAVDPVFSEAAVAPGVVEGHGVRGRYLVAIGGARRRGLEVAVAAWRGLRTRGHDLDLVVVGDAEAGPATRGTVRLGRLDDESWAGVLAGAEAFCYPTRFEGFGMPALEAAACGVPVVCGRVGPLPEVLGDAAEWCDAEDPTSVGRALARVVENPGRAAELRRLGLARARDAPTWGAGAQVLLDAYRRAGA